MSFFDIPFIGDGLEWAFDAGSDIIGGVSDFFFGSDDDFDLDLYEETIYGESAGLTGGGSAFEYGGSFLDNLTKRKQSQSRGGTSPVDIYNAKQLTALRRLSTQRAKQEAAKNIQRALPTSTKRKEDNRQEFIERARQPIIMAARKHLKSTMARYNEQLERNGMKAIQDYSVGITDEAPQYTKSPTAIG